MIARWMIVIILGMTLAACGDGGSGGGSTNNNGNNNTSPSVTPQPATATEDTLPLIETEPANSVNATTTRQVDTNLNATATLNPTSTAVRGTATPVREGNNTAATATRDNSEMPLSSN